MGVANWSSVTIYGALGLGNLARTREDDLGKVAAYNV